MRTWWKVNPYTVDHTRPAMARTTTTTTKPNRSLRPGDCVEAFRASESVYRSAEDVCAHPWSSCSYSIPSSFECAHAPVVRERVKYDCTLTRKNNNNNINNSYSSNNSITVVFTVILSSFDRRYELCRFL